MIGLKIGSKFSAPSTETERYNFAAIFVRSPAKNVTMQIVLISVKRAADVLVTMQVADHDLGAK